MLGNFSFGDYFKADAVAWAYELVTEVLRHRARPPVGHGLRGRRRGRRGLARRGRHPPSGSHPAVDATSRRTTGGPTLPGPCGPCSEIFVDRGSAYGPDGGPDVDEERFMEIWNLVFMQDEVDGERDVVAPLPGRTSTRGPRSSAWPSCCRAWNVFETDLLRPTARGGGEPVGQAARRGPARRHLAEDHRRARPRDRVPDRRRRAARPTRDVATSCAACSAVRSRTRGGSGIEHEVLPPVVASVVERVRRRVPRAQGERGLHPGGRRLGGGAVRGDPSPGHGAVRARRVAGPAAGSCPATTRSSCPTRSGSRWS